MSNDFEKIRRDPEIKPPELVEKTTEGLTHEERDKAEEVFNPVRSGEVGRLIEEITDPELRKEFARIYGQVLSLDAQIEKIQNAAILELAEETGIPAHLVQDSIPLISKGESAIEESDLILRHKQGEKKLEKFVESVKQAGNLFYIDQNLTAEQLTERLDLLGALHALFRKASNANRDKVEAALNKLFAIPTITSEVQTYLDERRSMSRQANTYTQGAENENFIHLGTELQSQVIKLSKDRHDSDFTSVLKLMRNMHALALYFNHEQPSGTEVQTRAVFRDMTIYRDAQGNYKRLVRQEFAQGISVKQLPLEIKNNPSFIAAWKNFFQHSESMKAKYGIVLDLTDSEAGMKPARGNVSNTNNIFVLEQDGKYIFSIIDPDVFDTVKGESKFDAREYLRKNGIVGGAPQALKVVGMNAARELVLYWQNQFAKKEIEK